MPRAALPGPDGAGHRPADGRELGPALRGDNKPGANEIIAADLVAKSPADGYTFLVASDGAYSLNQHLYPKIPYDPVKDFEPVAKLAVGSRCWSRALISGVQRAGVHRLRQTQPRQA